MGIGSDRQKELKAASKVKSKIGARAWRSERECQSTDLPHKTCQVRPLASASLPVGVQLPVGPGASTMRPCGFLMTHILALEHEGDIRDCSSCFHRMGWSKTRLKEETVIRKCSSSPGVGQGGPGRVGHLCLLSKEYTSLGPCFCMAVRSTFQSGLIMVIILRIST